MFVVSFKTTHLQLVASATAAAILLVSVLTLGGGSRATVGAMASAEDDGARRAALQAMGYEVSSSQAQVREILLPADTDETFSAYNLLQTEAGYDLSPYRGRRVKCWTYTVTNYPGEQAVQANLYVYKDKIIGGDVSSVLQGGFSHGLKPLTAG